MDAFVHFLHMSWHNLRFLPISPLAQLAPEADGEVLDGLLERAGVFRPTAPRLRDLDRLPQLRAYLGQPGGGPVSRFGDGSVRALYAGESLATCVAEMAFHHGRALAEGHEPAGAIRVFEALVLKVTGRFRDLRAGYKVLHRPGDYAPAQALGRTVKAAGEPGLAYRAVRHRGGACLALFLAAPVKVCTLKQMVALQWDGHRLG